MHSVLQRRLKGGEIPLSWLLRFQRWATTSALKLSALLVLFSIIPLVLFLYSADRLLRSSTERRLFQQGTEVGNLVARLIEQQFDDGKRFLRSVASRPSLIDAWRRGDMEELQRHLQQAQELAPNLQSVSIFAADGTLRVAYPPDARHIGKSFAEREWYKGVTRSWAPYVSNVYQNAIGSQELVVAIAVPMRDESGKPVAILMAPYSAATIEGWNRYLPKGTTRFTEVVDHAGNVVFANAAASRPGNPASQFEPVRRALNGQSGWGVFYDAGVPVQSVYHAMPSIGWGVVISVPFTEVHSAIWQFERPLLGLGALFVLIAVVFGSISAALSRQLRLNEAALNERNRELDLRNREVERANQMKSRFLASMSHELRTPLNAILGFSELLSDASVGPLSNKQARWVDHIRKAGKHLLQLINDILDLAKIEAGQVELSVESLEVGATVPEVISNTRPLAMAKRVRLEVKVESNVRIRADRLRFKQILYNLLSNAIKFTNEDGEVRLSAEQERDYVRFVVADTGIGIAPEDLPVIFEEFRQVGDQTTVREGTGLGLAITKRLVEQQGGMIQVESQMGVGTRMIFTLPIAHEEVLDVPAEPQMPVVRGQPVVLVVDDDPAACELIANYLQPEGYATAVAYSGQEALDLAEKVNPAAITLDILMASGSGWETLYAIRNSPKTKDIPIIVISVVDQKKLGMSLGATDYLVKPIERDVLLSALTKHLQPDKSSLHCVAADDEPETLSLVTEVLSQAGCTVRAATTGRQTLAELRAAPTDLLLLDLMMPDMDGFEVIREIEADPKLRDIPIVVLTAKSLSRDEIDRLSRTTRDLLQKGGQWQKDLLSRINRLTQGHDRTAK
jgi:signal transduction histidine kinase/CheY-like chemotaxis protein